MMGLFFLASLGLDALLGDPPTWPHPVNFLGRFIRHWDHRVSRQLPASVIRFLGALWALCTLLLAGALAYGLTALAFALHPLAGWAFALWGMETALAGRCLVTEAQKVCAWLEQGDLQKARRQVGMLVGRDTAELRAEEVAAAAVETVAENSSDGVVAPLFWAVIGAAWGPAGALAGAWVYKAVNTMDSLLGYRNAQYANLGWAPARIDDGFNYLPSRLTAALFCLIDALRGSKKAWQIWRRDGHKHLSPNAGHPEAAMAGLLGCTLGGGHFYGGTWVEKPTLGTGPAPQALHIRRACRALWALEGILALVFGLEVMGCVMAAI